MPERPPGSPATPPRPAVTVARLPDRQLAPLVASYGRAVAMRRRHTLLALALLLAATVLAAVVGDVDLPKFFANIGRFPSYLRDLAPPLSWAHLGADLADWYWNFGRWAGLLIDTLLTAYLGTLIGAGLAFGLCFAAAANLTPRRAVRLPARRLLELCRTIPDLVFALLFVAAFGLGAMAGVMALAIHTAGSLGKLFAEVVENIDMKPVEALIAAGATRLQAIRFAVLPQVLANFASYAMLRFEVNVRTAAVIGFVGAGGIGFDLMEAIRKFYYSDVSAILLMIVATVMVIDVATERLRHLLIGAEAMR